MLKRVCLFVGSFVRSFVREVNGHFGHKTLRTQDNSDEKAPPVIRLKLGAEVSCGRSVRLPLATLSVISQQESCAIAKMTAQCTPIRGCPENFRDSLTTPTATIPNIFHGLLFGWTL